jgi:hypothetical protein
MTQGFELFAKLGGDASGLQRALGNAQKSVGSAGQSMERLRRVGVRAFAALGAAAVAATATLVAFTRQGLRDVDNQAKLARSLDATIDGLRGVQIAAADAGIEAGALGTSLQMLNARTAEAARGTGSAAQAMKRLGLDAQALMRMDVDQRMAAIADRMKELGFSAAQAQDELGQLGIRNRQLALLMIEGGDAIRSARQEVDRYGMSLSEVDARRVEEANDSFRRLGRLLEAVRVQLAVELSGMILKVTNRFHEMIETAGGLKEVVRPAINVVIDLIGVLANAVQNARIVWAGLQVAIARSALAIVQFNELTGRATEATKQMGREIRKELLEAQSAMYRLLGAEIPSDMIARWRSELEDATVDRTIRVDIDSLPVEEGTEQIKGFFGNLLESIENNFRNMDQLAADMIGNMTARFGDAFEQMIFDSKSLGEAISQLAETMLRSIVNALGQIAAQFVASQAVQLAASKTTQAASAATAAAGGAAIAAAYAPAAAAASLASFGANAAPAMAGITATHTLSKTLALAGARERGGPVMSGRPYMVGERGPELMVPHGAGRIVPNNKLGGQSTMVTVNINAEDPGAEGRIRTMVERDMAPQIVQAAVGQTLGRLQRPSFA